MSSLETLAVNCVSDFYLFVHAFGVIEDPDFLLVEGSLEFQTGFWV